MRGSKNFYYLYSVDDDGGGERERGLPKKKISNCSVWQIFHALSPNLIMGWELKSIDFLFIPVDICKQNIQRKRVTHSLISK